MGRKPNEYPSGMKVCRQCHQEKPLTAFGTQHIACGRRSPRPRCRACESLNNRKQKDWPYQSLAERKTLLDRGLKQCYICHEILPLNQFFREKRSRDGYSYRCKTCDREQNKKWIAQHPGANTAYGRRYRERNPEKDRAWHRAWAKRNALTRRAGAARCRARKRAAEGHYTTQDVQAILKNQEHRCYYCKQPLRLYHVDHLVPIVRGGSNWPHNLCCACPYCNDSKGTRTAEEYLATGPKGRVHRPRLMRRGQVQ